jgi:transposase
MANPSQGGHAAPACIHAAGGLDCPRRYACPHLGFQSCGEVVAEVRRLRTENADLRTVLDTGVKAFAERDAELARLRAENEVLRRKLSDALQAPFRKSHEAPRTEPPSAQPDGGPARKKRGAPLGHRGATRPLPDREPDETIDVTPDRCPECGSTDIAVCEDVETHIQEDIRIVRPTVTLFRKRRGYCRHCRKTFFARGPGEVPHSRIGPVAKAAAEYLHYAARVPGQTVAVVFGALWGLPFTPSALVRFDTRTACAGRPVYDKIAEAVKYSATLNVDESGWPIGPAHAWIWVLTNPDLALFHIDPSRGSAVVKSILGENYGGVLGSDCFSGYNPVEAKAKQKCLTHYERTATEIEKFHPGDPAALAFAANVKDLLKEARQVKRDWLADALTDTDAAASAATFEARLDTLTAGKLDNKDAENLRQRFVTHRDANFTFLRYRDVEPDNNRAERALRPSVVARKTSYGSNSVLGAWNHETIMSLLETARLHGIAPLDVFMDLAKNQPPRALDALFAPRAPTPATPYTQPALADIGDPAGTHTEPGTARDRAPPA